MEFWFHIRSYWSFNYLRTKGYTRPLSVLKICADVWNKYNRFRHSTLLSMLTPECEIHTHTPFNARSTNIIVYAVMVNGSLVNIMFHQCLLLFFMRYKTGQREATLETIVKQLRQRIVLPGYNLHTWKPGNLTTRCLSFSTWCLLMLEFTV